ncbi:hypothetical protein F0562_025604 [Nyssa sinensis]|uniref:Uncharacterized protein n=1 Tax=Nyssa sinensis TaxID=561372 RepID=A0A5J5BAD4_9ASTE|nr:hypothetical protein F0562_025604 [Nyssa sinensis]
MTEQGFRDRSYGLGPGPGPSTHSPKGGGFKNLMRSRSVKDAWDKLSTKSEKKKKKDLRIEEIDPAFYRNSEVKQARLHHLWNPKKWAKSAKHAIAKYFIYENIPPSKAQAYYLNPAYHYEEDVRVKDSLLGSLRVVISRLETNPNRASQALAEVKIFREAMYGFAEQAAIRGRTRTDPGVGISEWLDDPGDALLDELDDDGQSNRPNTFLATWANHYSDDDMGRPSQSKSSMFPHNSREESSRGKQASVTLSSDDDDDDDDDDNDDDDVGDDGGNNNDEDSDNDDDDRTGGGNFGGSETENWERQSPSGVVFTEEQSFTHATQDEDHGSRRMLQYERRRRQGQPHSRAQNRNTPHGVDAIMRGMDMINSGLSSMSMSESEHDRRGGSSFSYGYGSRFDQPYGYDPRGYNLHAHGYGSSTYGYGSGYDSQASSSHGYGPAPALAPAQREGWIPAPTSQQLGCSVTEYERFRAEYEAWYHNYMNWADYCRHIHNTHNIPLDEYPELGPTYAPARHSTADWM